MIRQEVGKLVRSNTVDVLGIPGALSFLLGDKLDPHVHRDLKVSFQSDFMVSFRLDEVSKHLLLWDPVPPIIANTFFEQSARAAPSGVNILFHSPGCSSPPLRRFW